MEKSKKVSDSIYPFLAVGILLAAVSVFLLLGLSAHPNSFKLAAIWLTAIVWIATVVLITFNEIARSFERKFGERQHDLENREIIEWALQHSDSELENLPRNPLRIMMTLGGKPMACEMWRMPGKELRVALEYERNNILDRLEKTADLKKPRVVKLWERFVMRQAPA